MSRPEVTVVGNQITGDVTVVQQSLLDSSSNNDPSFLDRAISDQTPVEAIGENILQEMDNNAHMMDLDDQNDQTTSGSTTVNGQATRNMVGGEQHDQESSNHENNTVAQEMTEETTTMPKKRKADKDSWKKNVNKYKRAKGQAYMGRLYEKCGSKYTVFEKPAKLLGDRCNCKTAGVKCKDVTDETRQNIHKEVWAMSWPQKNILIKSLVHRVAVGRHRVEQSESSRGNTLKYNLNVGTGLVPV